MDFDATPINVTAMLVVGLALVAIVLLMKKKYDSNLPLLFYFIAMMFTNLTTMSVNPYLMLTGIALALILRFEFMGSGFTKMIAWLNSAALGLIVWVFLVEIFGNGQAPF